MNQIQFVIIGVVVVVIFLVIAYHFYQENKFRKTVDTNFSNSRQDALQEDGGVIFENQQHQFDEKMFANIVDIEPEIPSKKTLKQDKIGLMQTELTAEDYLSDEDNVFLDYDQKEFTFANKIVDSYFHVVDIVFDKPVKINVFPDLAQFTSRNVDYYVLDKNGWQLFEKGHKFNAIGAKVAIELVDDDGCTYPLQIENIVNELSKFVEHHHGVLRSQNSENKIKYIQQQAKHAKGAVLELELFMVNKNELRYEDLAKYFTLKGFVDNNGIFEYRNDNHVVAFITDEKGNKFNIGQDYRLFALNSKLHHQANPMAAVNFIFDVAEDYMANFESRLLTSNKLLMSDREYKALERHVQNYITSCHRNNIQIGSDLIIKLQP